MKDTLLKLYIKMQNLLAADEGQDLVEYALLVSLLALGATTGLSAIASKITQIWTAVGTQLVS